MSAAFRGDAVDHSLLQARLAREVPRRIAIVQTAFLGDTVFTSALVAGVAARFPSAKITLVVTPRGRDVAAATPHVHDVLVYDKRSADRGLSGFLRAARALRERQCDVALLPHRSLRSSLLAWRAGIRERVGFSDAPGRLLYTSTARDPGGPFLLREAALLAALGGQSAAMQLIPTVESSQAAEHRLELLGVASPIAADAGQARSRGDVRLVGLALGSEWETKIWPTEQFAELAKRLAARGLTPLLLGGPRETQIAEQILRACPEALDTTGNPISEALALLATCVLCVGGDTGLSHAARALSIPTLLLFGPTDPALHQIEIGSRALSLNLSCSPCGMHGARRCPVQHHRCMRDLSASQVEAAAVELLSAQSGDRVE